MISISVNQTNKKHSYLLQCHLNRTNTHLLPISLTIDLFRLAVCCPISDHVIKGTERVSRHIFAGLLLGKSISKTLEGY